MLPARDVYFDPGYGRAAAHTEGGTLETLELRDGLWVFPLVVRELPSGRRDAVSPYGYSGVYADPRLAPDEVEALWRETRSILSSEGVVSVFVRPSPLVPQAPVPSDAIRVGDGHTTYYVPCLGYDKNWDSYAGRARTTVRRHRKLGGTCSMTPVSAAELAAGSVFRELYETTMRKVSATDYYLFDDEYHARLSEGLGDHLSMAIAHGPGGEPHAAALFLRGDEHLHYHLSGSSPEGLKASATSVILDEAIRHANETGLSGVHLGGGVRPGDSLSKFKQSFGGREREFYVYGLIVDDEAYRDETACRELGAGDPHTGAVSGFFPAYRAPRSPR